MRSVFTYIETGTIYIYDDSKFKLINGRITSEFILFISQKYYIILLFIFHLLFYFLLRNRKNHYFVQKDLSPLHIIVGINDELDRERKK